MPRRFETPLGLDGERAEALDRDDELGEMAEDRRRISGSRADIEHVMLLAQIERPERQSEVRRRTDDLAATHRQRDVAPGEVALRGGGEEAARHRLESAQHVLVVHAARSQAHQEVQGLGRVTRALEAHAALSTGSSNGHARASAPRLRAALDRVRFSCDGVTEMRF